MNALQVIGILAVIIAGGFAIPGWIARGATTPHTVRCRFLSCAAFVLVTACAACEDIRQKSWGWLAVSTFAFLYWMTRTSHWWRRWKTAQRLAVVLRAANPPLPTEFDR